MSDDPVAQRLREAVWADPEPDAPRMVYADYLLEHGDPLGELIALQLDRARTGEPVSDRERELSHGHARRMIDPAADYLEGWTLGRGFVQSLTPGDGPFPRELVDHPMWSTVERMTVKTSHPLLDSRALSLRTLHVGYNLFRKLPERTAPLPCVALAGTPDRALTLNHPELFDHQGAFDRVRAVSVDGHSLDNHARAILNRRLFSQLEHLDLTFGINGEVHLDSWRAWLDSTQLARLSARLPLQEDISESIDSYSPSSYIYVEVERGGDRVILQLDDTLYPDHDSAVVAVVAAIGGFRRRVLVEDLEDSKRCAERRASTLAALIAAFDEVVVASGPVRSRAP